LGKKDSRTGFSLSTKVRAGVATILAIRKAAGRPMSQFDAMIAAIARAHRAALATRNTGDFEHCGIRLVNPWHVDPWADVH
jgi:predicted nucleic acid-binding protein